MRIRRALALSLDTKEIVDVVMEGTAQANNSPLPIGSPFYGPVEAQGYTQNIAEAKKLLIQAGYKGQPITLIANKQYPTMYSAAVLVQAMAASSDSISDRGPRLGDAARPLSTRRLPGDVLRLFATPRSVADVRRVRGRPKATEPRKVWDDPRAEELLRQSTLTLDHDKRQAAFDATAPSVLADVPLIPLFNNTEISATRSDVVGFKGWLRARSAILGRGASDERRRAGLMLAYLCRRSRSPCRRCSWRRLACLRWYGSFRAIRRR